MLANLSLATTRHTMLHLLNSLHFVLSTFIPSVALFLAILRSL